MAMLVLLLKIFSYIVTFTIFRRRILTAVAENSVPSSSAKSCTALYFSQRFCCRHDSRYSVRNSCTCHIAVCHTRRSSMLAPAVCGRTFPLHIFHHRTFPLPDNFPSLFTRCIAHPPPLPPPSSADIIYKAIYR